MTIDFLSMAEQAMEHFKGGENTTFARMFFDGRTRIMQTRLPVGASIGEHTHETNCEVMYILSGEAKVIFDGQEERILPGQSHYCPKGHTHTTISTGSEDLVMFCVVAEQ